jgi:hypothetical protein
MAPSLVPRVPLGHVVIGPPNAFTTFAFDVAKIVLATQPSRSVRPVDRTDSISDLALARPVYLCNFPSLEIVDAIESGDLAVLFVDSDALRVTHPLRLPAGAPPHEAIRAQTASAIANLAIGRSAMATRLGWSATKSVAGYAKDVGRWLSIAIPDEDIAGLCQSLGFSSDEAWSDTLFDQHSADAAPDAFTQELTTLIVDPLFAMALGQASRPVVWPTEVFFSGDHLDHQAPKVADVTGPARVIYYGPYFHLPPAKYRVEAILAFSKHIEDVPFSLEIHGSYCLARVRIDPRAEGAYRGEFNLTHRVATDTLEIRLRIDQGAIEGQVSLSELRFFVDDQP